MTESKNTDDTQNAQGEAMLASSEQAMSAAAPTTTTPTKKPAFTSAAVLPSQMSQNADQPISSNAFVTGSNMNGGCVMTGRPSSRVLAPPGGHTSIKLG
jgi:hypothetical protein